MIVGVPSEVKSDEYRVGVRPVGVATGTPANLATMRIVGYADGGAAQAVVSIAHAGLTYREQVLRKADVVVARGGGASAS